MYINTASLGEPSSGGKLINGYEKNSMCLQEGVRMVASDWLEGALTWRGEWRCVSGSDGAVCVMMNGNRWMLTWHADS